MDRALREFRVRGVKTNIPFLENVILHPTFLSGQATTTFIDRTPELLRFKPRRDRATKILRYLGDVIINGRPDVKGKVDPKRVLPRAARAAISKGHRGSFGHAPRNSLNSGQKSSPSGCESKSGCCSRIRPCGMRTSRCWPRACAPLDLLAVSESVAHLAPQLFSLEIGAAPRSIRPCASSRKTPGIGWRDSRTYSQHPLPDAAARQQCGGLYELSRQRRP
jgi:pyruvate carboxylase